MVPTFDAFRALGKEVCNRFDVPEGRPLLHRLLKHHFFSQRIAMLVQTDIIEIDSTDTSSAVVAVSSLYYLQHRTGDVPTTFSVVRQNNGSSVVVINDDTVATARTIHDA